MQRGGGDDRFRIRERRFSFAAQFQEFRRASRNVIIDGMRDKRHQKILGLFLVVGLSQQPNFQVRPDRRVQVALFGELLRKGQCFRDAAQTANQNIRVEQIITHAAPFV